MDQLIVSWSPVSSAGRAAQAVKLWHFLPAEGAASTLCEMRLPVKREDAAHAEIDTADLRSLKGFCITCFHTLCIEKQDPRLWDVFEPYEKLREDISSIRIWLQGVDGSKSDKEEAIGLFEKFLSHTLVDSALGGSEGL
jgi:hypothetical protein